jgi:hypothetical protein
MKEGVGFAMPLFTYRCPTTGHRVQGFSADDVSEDTHTYESVLCVMCGRFHFVNPATGVVMGQEGTQAESHKGLPNRST